MKILSMINQVFGEKLGNKKAAALAGNISPIQLSKMIKKDMEVLELKNGDYILKRSDITIFRIRSKSVESENNTRKSILVE